MSEDARTAYLFQRKGEDLFAVSHDQIGSNMPRTTCAQGWAFIKQFQLGVYEPVPAGVMPETILQGIFSSGYFIWRGQSPGDTVAR
jgi:hypothetical protein